MGDILVCNPWVLSGQNCSTPITVDVISVLDPHVPVESPIQEVLQHTVVGQEPQQAITILGPDTEGTERGWQTQQFHHSQHLLAKRETENGAGSCRRVLYLTLLLSSLHKVLTYHSNESSINASRGRIDQRQTNKNAAAKGIIRAPLHRERASLGTSLCAKSLLKINQGDRSRPNGVTRVKGQHWGPVMPHTATELIHSEDKNTNISLASFTMGRGQVLARVLYQLPPSISEHNFYLCLGKVNFFLISTPVPSRKRHILNTGSISFTCSSLPHGFKKNYPFLCYHLSITYEGRIQTSL